MRARFRPAWWSSTSRSTSRVTKGGSILLASYGLNNVAWELTEDTVEVHVTDAPGGKLALIRSSGDPDAALETHASYRVEEAG